MADATATASFDLPGFGGELFHPGTEDYEEARKVFNGMIDRRPALIARCSNADDVAAAVNLARDEDLPLSIYGGGHGVTGSAVVDAGICVDLRGLTAIDVDPEARTVRAEAGLRWGALDAATQEHGLALTGGRASDTGLAGLALGSGSGWLERKLGFTCDSLFKAELVTADGRQVVASEDENPELFWGLRGGGGNFGVVTAFHFNLHEVGPIVLGGMLLYPARDGGRAGALLPRLHGRGARRGGHRTGVHHRAAGGVRARAGARPAGGGRDRLLRRPAGGRRGGAAAAARVRPARARHGSADALRGRAAAASTLQISPAFRTTGRRTSSPSSPDEAVDTLVGHATNPVSPLTTILLFPGGGAIARVDDDAMAFGQRSAPWNVHYLSMWDDPADTEANIAYTRAIASAMKPWTTGRVYLNFIGDEGSGRVEAAFGPEKFARLQALKDEWDPTNLFRHNQNIPPSAG